MFYYFPGVFMISYHKLDFIKALNQSGKPSIHNSNRITISLIANAMFCSREAGKQNAGCMDRFIPQQTGLVNDLKLYRHQIKKIQFTFLFIYEM